MTIETFRSSVRGYRRSEWARGALFFGLLASASFPVLFVERRLDRMTFDTVAVVVLSVSYTVIAAAMFYVLAPMRRRRLKKLQGNCPTCGKLLLGRHSGEVMKSGQCPDCGSRIFR
jgi:DNA-directed RNA polymerase subunit RPC12/RpoP